MAQKDDPDVRISNIKMDTPKGADMDTASKIAIRLAMRHECNVEFEFNSTTWVVKYCAVMATVSRGEY